MKLNFPRTFICIIWQKKKEKWYKAAQLFKSFEFGNRSRMSDENLVILEFKYLQNKKW